MGENVQRRTSRKRRALLLRERVQVIEMYNTKPRPNYDSLAKMFNCGRSQIKNILRQKGQILQEYQKDPDSDRVRRLVPPILLALNSIVHEWLKRALGYKTPFGGELILEQAVRVAKFLDFDEFEPSKAWLRSFKRRHGYYRVDLQSLNVPEDKTKSLKIRDIFEHVKNSIDFNIKQAIELKLMGDSNCIVKNESDSVEIIDSKMDEENESWDISLEEFPSSENNDENVVIKDNNDALDYLKPLEDFALLTDNFRAIGLISQLESVFRAKIRNAEDL